MSANESFEIDQVRHEQKSRLTEEDEDNLNEFVGQLQDAFSFANKSNLNEQLIFIAIEKTFEEYFDGTSIEIKLNINEMLKNLIRGNISCGQSVVMQG